MEKIFLCLLTFFVFLYGPSRAQINLDKSKSSNVLLPFESTVTYKMLRMDPDLVGFNQDEILVCKQLMEKAAKRITTNYSSELLKNADANLAITILKMIDSTFTEFDFLFYTNPDDPQYSVLTLAFKNQFQGKRYFGSNKYREDYWDKRSEGKEHRRIDCDLYSRIYVGIAQMASLPLTMVHIPEHYYIRWHFPSSEYISWNPNDGSVHYNDSTMECYHYWKQRLIENPERLYPPDMDLNDVVNNYVMIKGDLYFLDSTYKDIGKAKKVYEELLSRCEDPGLINNYVWLYIMNPEYDESFDEKKLHNLIDVALLQEKNLNFYDAKACVYALKGDFVKAINTVNTGLRCSYDPFKKKKKANEHLKCFERKEVCRKLN